MRVKDPIFRFIILGQASLLAFLLLCLLILPDVHQGPGGLSNYGVYRKTIFLYTLGFSLAAVFSWKAGMLITQSDIHSRIFRYLLYGLGAGYFIVLLSTYPYQVNELLDSLHRRIGTAFFVYLNIVTAWIVNDLVRKPVGVTLLFLIIIGSMLAMLSIHEYVGLLSHSQIIVGASFGLLLTIAAWRYSLRTYGTDK